MEAKKFLRLLRLALTDLSLFARKINLLEIVFRLPHSASKNYKSKVR